MLRQWAKAQPNPAAVSDFLDTIHPLGKCPEADVIADACVFLLFKRLDSSPDTSCMSLAVLNWVIDGNS